MDRLSAKTLVSAWVVAAALGGGTAFAQGTTGTTGSTGSTTGATTAAPTAPAGSSAGMTRRSDDRGNLDRGDARFVREAAMSNMAEIESSKVALQRASDPKVRQLAQHMVDDHTKATEKLKTLASSKGVQPDTTLDRKHQRLMDKLSKAEGKDFDKQYVKMQEDDHEKAVKLFEKEAKSGKDPDLKQFAEQLVPNLREHLQAVRDLRSNRKSAASDTRPGMQASTR